MQYSNNIEILINDYDKKKDKYTQNEITVETNNNNSTLTDINIKYKNMLTKIINRYINLTIENNICQLFH